MTIANITINGHTYTDSDWRTDWEAVISAVANDIASVQAGIDAVGTLTKTLSGSTTLSGSEGQNLVFVFDGSLSGDATVTFPSGFKGLACIINKTSGGHQLVIGLASGATVTIPASGGALLYCDGTDFGITDGWVRTSTGVKTAGTMLVGGAATVTGAFTASGTASIAGAATIAGAASLSSTLAVTGNTTITGGATLSSTLNTAGNATLSGAVSVGGNMTGAGTAAFDGNVTVAGGRLVVENDADEARVALDAPAAESAWLEFNTGGVLRILVGKNNTSESGGDAGSDFDVVMVDDSGSINGTPLRIYRGSLYIRMNALPSSPAGLESGVIWYDPAADNVLKKA